jgi:hypothetical protein
MSLIIMGKKTLQMMILGVLFLSNDQNGNNKCLVWAQILKKL